MGLLDGDPRWQHRRRLVYATVALAWVMIAVAMLDWTDRQVSSQLVIGAVSLLSIVLTAYTAFGTLDDRWQRKPDGPSDFDTPYRGTDGDGLAR